MSKNKKYQILSPDGFEINPNINYYKSIKEVKQSFYNWVERYKIQGYYSSPNYGKINLNDIEYYCTIIEI